MVSIIPPIDNGGKPIVELSMDAAFYDLSSCQIKIVDEGAGAFVIIEAEKWRVDPDELMRVARWVRRACGALDGFHAKRDAKTPQRAIRNDTNGIQ